MTERTNGSAESPAAAKLTQCPEKEKIGKSND